VPALQTVDFAPAAALLRVLLVWQRAVPSGAVGGRVLRLKAPRAQPLASTWKADDLTDTLFA